MVTALPDDEVKKILYHIMPHSCRKKMTTQGYNYLEKKLDFFETRVENLETPTPPPAVRSLTKKKKIPRRGKLSPFEDSDENSSDDKKPLSKKKFCQHHGKCSHSMNECTTLKALIKKANPTSSKDTGKEARKSTTNMK